MTRLLTLLILALVVVGGASLFLGEASLSSAQYGQAFVHPGSIPGEILWSLRAPRFACAAIVGAALLTGASVTLAGVIGFVGIAAPHLVRRVAGEDAQRILLPSALAGAVLLSTADVVARLIPTDQSLKLGVIAALFGAPLFVLAAWRAARSWRE